ncbi:F-actin-monooxygenase MICAL2 isoform X4 [Oryzias melastigma]|uniref:F-actin monooxygenase n=1 Tax=Oryzias melastigma TaxID=30732 RepID=A0A3B3CWK6_ORYME|nr:F-actin-monooxygenase MICAL2 isoform X4 [Oryzias melastigma]
MGKPEEENVAKLFENFIQASTCKGALQAFNVLCRRLDLDPADHDTFYSSLKAKVSCWKANALWSKLDKRMSHKEYKKGQACVNTKCLIIGGGPCGLRTAIELALMGAKVVVLEKRDSFSRNNVLHLWPFTIHDLRGLGAKKFHGKFCAGAIDHISIQQLQLILLKVALIVAVEFHINVEFVKLLEPPEDQTNEGVGWRAAIRPADHPVANFDFDVVVGADGRKNSLEGFKRKVLRGKLAIAITANFINNNTTAEARVEEISGVAFIFNQKFFLDLKEKTGIDLENIVYYKDNTHYFVMTAKKQSLLEKGVLINDYVETEMLLSSQNVNQEALLSYATEAADFGTHYQLPTLKFAENHCGQPDVAMFDFTNMYASENAALVRERHGHQLLVALVGDSLLEPFWPMGTGCARGFLSGFDTAWMVKSWAEGRSVLEVLAERESIYRLLPQTTPENIAKNFDLYTIDPSSRYINLNSTCVRPNQVHHLYITGELYHCSLERAVTIRRPINQKKDWEIRPSRLLTWCKKQTECYRSVSIKDLSSSWESGLALCALIHRFKPQLIDFDSLNEEDHRANLQLALDISEQEFGIQPFTSTEEQSTNEELDKSRVTAFLSKFYELFRGSPLPASETRSLDENKEFNPSKEVRCDDDASSFLSHRKRIPKDEKKTDSTNFIYKRRRTLCPKEVTNLSDNTYVQDKQNLKENKVGTLSTQLLAKFESKSSYSVPKTQGASVRRVFSQSAEKCHSCEKRVYMIERVRAEGLCFHRECFRCSICSSALPQGLHVFNPDDGKLYCKLHFDQQNNGAHLKRTFSLPSNQFGGEERSGAAEEESACSSTADLQSRPAAGTCSLFTRKQLSWPLSVTRAVCRAPSYLSCCVRRAAQAVAGHLRDNANDYMVLFELLSLSLPLLFVLQEVLLQMHTEAVTDGPSFLQPALFWLQEQVGLI